MKMNKMPGGIKASSKGPIKAVSNVDGKAGKLDSLKKTKKKKSPSVKKQKPSNVKGLY